MSREMCAAPASPTQAGYNPQKLERMMHAVKDLLKGIGEDPEREGLRDTPKRVAKALLDMSSGYSQDAHTVMGQAVFHEPLVSEGGGGMVMVRNIDFASTCESTLLPFHGTCHLAYLPKEGHVLGLSKLARIVRVFARRLQNQQRLTDQTMEALAGVIGALGAAVVFQARHLADGPFASHRVTFAASGSFSLRGAPCWLEFLTLLRLHGVSVSHHAFAPSPAPSPAGLGALAGLTALPLAPITLLETNGVKAVSSADDLSSLLHVTDAMAQAGSEDSDETLMMLTDDTPRPPVIAVGMDEDADTSPSSSSPQLRKRFGSCSRASNGEQMAESVRTLLREMGADPSRPELALTGERYVRSLLASTSGYERTVTDVLRTSASFPDPTNSGSSPTPTTAAAAAAAPARASIDLQVTRNGARWREVLEPALKFASQCEHHMLPFYGQVHVAYALGSPTTPAPPDSQPLARASVEGLVGVFSQRLQIQERFTHQLADAVAASTGAAAVLIVCDASHMCMVARGVEKHASATITVATRGWYAGDARARESVLERLLQNVHAAA